MSIETGINICKDRVILKRINSGIISKYTLPVPTFIQYDTNWANVSFNYVFNYAFPHGKLERRINDLSKKMETCVTYEPPNNCGLATMVLHIPRFDRVSIQDKSRTEEVKRKLFGNK